MKRLMNFLRGMATILVTGPFPERLINLCAQERVEFWSVEWQDEHTLRLVTRRRFLAVLEELAQRCGCEVQVEMRRGLPDFLLRFRTRYGFLIGLTLSLCAVAVLSRFVLTIEVTGNDQVPTAVILTQLRQLGVRPGVYGPSLERTQIAQEVMLHLDGLAWVGINLHGTRLEVIVREVVPKPDPVDETQWYDVTAEADGIITHIEAELGDALVKEGDTVLAGEVLISGTVTMEPPQYSDLPARYYQTHARGRVWARTWRELSASIPLEAFVKVYTGEEKDIWFFCMPGQRISILGNDDEENEVDKMVWTKQLMLPGNVALPICLTRETLRTYELQQINIDQTAAQALLENQLSQRLETLIGTEGEVLLKDWNIQIQNGSLIVTLRAECTEEIGEEQPGRPLPGQGGGL